MAQPRPIGLVVVLTCGFVSEPAEDLQPSEIGIRRMNVAAQLLEGDSTLGLCISGGMRDKRENSEAAVYASWFMKNYPNLAARIWLISAEAKFTAHDMVRLAQEVYDQFRAARMKLLLVSHPDHTSMARTTLEATIIGMRKDEIVEIDSGEPPPYSWLELLILRTVYRFDPRWEKWISAPLRKKGNQRGT